MKKVVLVVSLFVGAIVMTSCFGRECVCKEKINGKTVEKIIVKDSYYGDCESEYDAEDGYEYKCR